MNLLSKNLFNKDGTGSKGVFTKNRVDLERGLALVDDQYYCRPAF